MPVNHIKMQDLFQKQIPAFFLPFTKQQLIL